MSTTAVQRQSMQDKRSQVRKKANDIVEVFDRSTDLCVGKIVNLTTDGMMLISDAPIPINTIFQLRISFPELIEGVDFIDCGAETLWYSPTNDESTFWTGFQIIDIAEKDAGIIDKVIERWES